MGLDRRGLRELSNDATLVAVRWRCSLFAVVVVDSACLAAAASIADYFRRSR